MVSPHFFFEGKLSREEAASALMATLLEQSGEFRSRFCRHCGLSSDDIDRVEIEVERNEVDISMTFPTLKTTVIVENKISSGSKEDGQLARYYEKASVDEPEYRYICVYLAPTEALGESEVAQLLLRDDDVSLCLTWETVNQLARGLGDFDANFAEEGCRKVLEAIANRREAYYARSGDRALLYDIAELACRRVNAKSPPFAVRTWKSVRSVEVYTFGTALTVSVSIQFNPLDNGLVKLPRRDELPVVTISAAFRPAVKYAREETTRRWWDEATSSSSWNINDVELRLNSANWLANEREMCGTAEQIAEEIERLTLMLIYRLEEPLRIPQI